MHVVLVEPDIPFNTGNVGRSCLATGSTLHLVGRMGFVITDAKLKRAGLDYWPKVKLVRHESWDAFEAQLPPDSDLFFFSKRGRRSLWSATFPRESYLIFGCETTGLPASLVQRYADRLYAIPMQQDSVRSLNLSTAVGVVLYEALRQNRPHALHPQETR
jgi:tRNA (cytidine/uridine-2'-O-)-methyltransferase